jgi:hypothetical protein
MSGNENTEGSAELCETLNTARLELTRGRSNRAREILAHACAMRAASISLCDHLCNFGMCTDESEAGQLYDEIQTAWAASKSSFRLLDTAMSGS